jgi:hypothetical protein
MILVQVDMGKNQDHISRIARAKRAGGMAYKDKALSSKSNTVTHKQNSVLRPQIGRLSVKSELSHRLHSLKSRI